MLLWASRRGGTNLPDIYFKLNILVCFTWRILDYKMSITCMTTIQEDKLEQRQKIFCLQNLFYRVYPIMNVVRERRRWRYQLHRQRPPMVSEIRVGWRVATISLSTHDSLPDTTHLCPCDHTWPAKKNPHGVTKTKTDSLVFISNSWNSLFLCQGLIFLQRLPPPTYVTYTIFVFPITKLVPL